MDDAVDTLLVEVRAGTEGFARDVERMRASVDGNLVAGFARAGDVLERGLTGAIRKGSLGFDDLKRVALDALEAVAAQSLKGLIGGGGAGSGLDLSGIAGALLGLPGRATGGNVAPGRGYMVGERGPEVFVPTSAGRIEPAASRARDVRVSINLAAPAGSSAPRSLQRSSRQVASAVRRALSG
ncbi:hypothetical protein HNO88_003384 [Novosphingobium chloroacetimidivorans]|uniref:Tail tape measure protein n=1 Tax=Novosphingobium chloroacetimidivorans TaxID=1428314 RepID=A0A7W7NX48_9SPHN|nr:tail tape measure protein [Novosphingobium chloroacetimidivorans]MBB4860046.1 hypothetical protein [Novosphingobium chloroacetimidivorans]